MIKENTQKVLKEDFLKGKDIGFIVEIE